MGLREYHLHKGDYSKLQLDINDSKSYCEKNVEHCFKPHRHSFYQIIWFKSKGKHFVDYVEYEHPENSLFLISKGQVHYFSKECPNEGYLIHFNDVFLHKERQGTLDFIQFRLFDDFTSPLMVLENDQTSKIELLKDALVEEIEEKPSNYKQQLYHYIQILLLSLERLKSDSQHSAQLDPHMESAVKFKNLVNEHKNEFRSVSFYSQQIGVSEKTLNTISKKYINDTPANFIHKTRILEAKRLLSNTHLTKKEIAYQLGFEQPTYFTKYFKKHTSLTPKEFQKSFL